MTGTVISVIIALLCLNTSFGQSYKKSNLEILEQNISGELEKFYYYPDLNRNFQFVFFVTSAKQGSEGSKEKRFIESVIKKSAAANNLKISFANDEQMLSSDSIYNKVRIDIDKLSTRYPRFTKNNFLGEKTIQRDVSSELRIDIKSTDGNVNVSDKISTNYKDVIQYDEYEQYENEELRFTKGIAPNVSWLETIAFPVAVVTVSAVAAILFFTIRSK